MKKVNENNPKSTDEVGVTRVESFVRISDPQTGKTIVETRA